MKKFFYGFLIFFVFSWPREAYDTLKERGDAFLMEIELESRNPVSFPGGFWRKREGRHLPPQKKLDTNINGLGQPIGS